MNFCKSLFNISLFMSVLSYSSSAFGAVMTIGPGVQADVTTTSITPRTIVSNIRNLTGQTANDFNIRITGVPSTFVEVFTFDVNENNRPDFVMTGEVSNGGTLEYFTNDDPPERRTTVVFSTNVGRVSAFWTKDGEVIRPKTIESSGILGLLILGSFGIWKKAKELKK